MSDLVLYDRQESVVVLTLNRPDQHNSLVPPLLEELLAALERIGEDDQLGAAVLQANGRSYSTGGDMGGFWEHRGELAAYSANLVGLLNQVILALVGLPCPLVAAVQGMVTGGSLGMVLGCDLVLVSPEASFTPYYGVVGFGPDGGWTAILPEIIGAKRAAELIMCNGTMTADQAVAWGLASRVVPGDRIRSEALDVARRISGMKRGAVTHAKRLLRVTDLVGRLESERQRFVQQIVTPEAARGIENFMAGKAQ